MSEVNNRSNPTETVHELYERHGDSVNGMFHNMLWQIVVNNSCDGAFSMHWDRQVIIAQADGGYIPGMCGIEEGVDPEPILADLNEQVFGLTKRGVDRVIMQSVANSAKGRVKQ